MGPRLRRPREAAGCACASSVLSRACAISHSLPLGNARNSPAQSAGFFEVLMRVQYATSSSVKTRAAKVVRVNVTLPADVLAEIDRYAEAHGFTRSGFLAQAAKQAIKSAA